MINGKKIVVVLPAYNAALTLKRTYDEIPFDIVDDVVLVDDHSKDNTAEVGWVRMIKTQRISDGIVRLYYVAQERAI